MSNICLLVGQCGNQLGSYIYDGLYNDSYSKSDDSLLGEKWFHSTASGTYEARSVRVDAELKVIEKESTKRRPWVYPRRSLATADCGGSANNWSLGYSTYGAEICHQFLDCLQSEAEKCDHVNGILPIFSSAGGTGSGVGSYLCENVKELLPKKTMVNALVLPYSKGEVTVQNYNTLFTISKLTSISDGVLLFNNDYVHKMCSQVLKIENVSLDDINEFIADQLIVTLNAGRETNTLNHVIPYLTNHPLYKLLNLRGSPYSPEKSHKYDSAVSWSSIMLHLKMMLLQAHDWSHDFKPTSKYVSHSTKHKPLIGATAVGIFSVTRGAAQDANAPQILNADCLYPAWLPLSRRFYQTHRSTKFKGRDKMCVVMANNGFHNEYLKNMIDRAWKLFSNNAYVHHYSRHQIKEKDFVEAFTDIQHTVKSYEKLCPC